MNGKLSRKVERLGCDQINMLFDAVIFELGVREWEIFKSVLGESKETHKTLLIFLKDVSTCPQEIIEYCQEILATRKKTVPFA